MISIRNLLSFLFLFIFLSSNVYASGYMLNEYSMTSLGRAFAGAGVVGDDLSAIGANPAGMQLTKTPSLQLGATAIQLNGKFSGTVNALGYGNARVEIQAVVPNVFFIMPVNDRLKVGLGVYAPFGLGTKYADTAITKYNAIDSDLQVIEIAPAVSFEIIDGLSVGVTANIQHGSALLSQKAPSGTPFGDAKIEIEGATWAYGGTFGVMYEFNDNNRIGLSYRMAVKHKTTGEMKTILPVKTMIDDIDATLNLPDAFILSGYSKLNDHIALSASLRYIMWSVFKDLTISDTNTGAVINKVDENWQNTFSGHLGIDWFANPFVTIRGGVAYDQTPIKNAHYRTARIPENSKVMVSIGSSFKATDSLSFDVGYTHLFIQNAKINNKHGQLVQEGEYSFDFMSYLVGVQAQYKF